MDLFASIARRFPRPLACHLEADGRYVQDPVSEGWDGPGAGAAALTFSLDLEGSPLHQVEVYEAFRAALEAWARSAALSLREVESGGQISLRFGHAAGCPYSFGAGAYAHGFYPPDLGYHMAGQIHLNPAADWTRIDVASVIMHEIGHALGLPHSVDPEDLMYPWYKGHRRLSMGDQFAIAQLYRVRFRPAASIGVNL
jgi:hypothetical protein